jgi:hypothetical protein
MPQFKRPFEKKPIFNNLQRPHFSAKPAKKYWSELATLRSGKIIVGRRLKVWLDWWLVHDKTSQKADIAFKAL